LSTAEPLWSERATVEEIEQGSLFAPLFDKDGLLPAIVADARSGETLMFAWMDREALRLTLTTGYAHFWSRSRKRIWRKGEESGNCLAVRGIMTDCDQDVLMLEVDVEGDGIACHTGARSCFYRSLDLASGHARPLRLSRTQGSSAGS